ncbi:2-keto-4-pentenoate hydratase [Alicycliphilus denitrificans]|uniref:2-oxo-3-hexenedioate decarboxylase n=1 Tax=Alicycliphilus denitrificans TaxID=179636 RepID=UPI000959A691|nr:2-oxo-3-hexenedioate decarboxylase [Alicycliphilus denitrificans]MBN9573024.1 2-oxo-3-hexenedioate decarboxylase [Alicycliphilus denitrificans]OJW93153.1 MAG: 4-oxalocrotonate decarboxylase [Alicycliphilus sp. 69-12]BCN37006.1 2-keto-4-pentenoate hydratase [Alicycliphilus denitrificans]HRO82395.1 2-oxo-3-hexenedioate decarboxylase [Alicycliphilus denitrificans]
MALNEQTIERLAEHLENCQLQVRDTPKITDEHPGMDWDDAYAIQDAILARKLSRGARVVGLKAGLTSHAKMRQMGVTDPVFGFLVDGYAVAEGAAVDTRALIHPKVEPEIAFVLKHALKGPGCHIGAVLAATDFVMPGIEVIDSRYRDFKFDLKSVIADNTSAARFVVGGRAVRPEGVDLRTVGVVLEKNGQPVALGAGAAVLGHPAAAIAMLANHLGRRGREIPAGSLILSGGVTEAVAVAAGDSVSLRVQGMGCTNLRFD